MRSLVSQPNDRLDTFFDGTNRTRTAHCGISYELPPSRCYGDDSAEPLQTTILPCGGKPTAAASMRLLLLMAK